VKYVENDPYASLNYINGPLTLDGGLRQQNQTVTGTNTTNNGAAFAAGSPLAPGNTWGAPSLINYQLHKINYSFGANYALEKDLSLYGSASRGYNFSPLDRMVGAVDGSSPASFNQVDQYDFGVRTRSGPLSFSGTFFIAKTNESNYDLTINQFSQNNYSANGFETEVGYHVGGFRITGNATLTNAKIVSSTVAGVNSGNAPQRQAKLTYAVTPSYSIGDFMIGGSMIGTTSSYGDMQNTVTMPGYTVFNLFTSYQFNKQMLGSISVNNLFNSLAYTEFDNVGAGTASAARALPGRTMYATLKYNF
jgi:outer membrane receptor protein involved in Fe transport